MNIALLKILNEIVAEYGETILSEPRRVSALFADLAQDVPKPQKNAFLKCLEHGFVQVLKNTEESERENCKQRLVQKLHNDEGLDLGLCKDTLDLLESVLFGSPTIKPASQTEPQVPPKLTPEPAEQKTSPPLKPVHKKKKKIRYLLIAVAGLILILIWMCNVPASTVPANPAQTSTSNASQADLQAFIVKGQQYLENGEYDNAIKQLTEAIRLNPNYAQAYRLRGTAYTMTAQMDNTGEAYTLTTDNVNNAIKDFSEVLRFEPDDAYTYSIRGILYMYSGQITQAIQDFERALSLEPDNELVKQQLSEILGN